MSDFLAELMHSWGTKPDQKRAEKKYNAEYYQEHKDKWKQAYESMKRQERKETNEAAKRYDNTYKDMKKREEELKKQLDAYDGMDKASRSSKHNQLVKKTKDELASVREDISNWEENAKKEKDGRFKDDPDSIRRDMDKAYSRFKEDADRVTKLPGYDKKTQRVRSRDAGEAQQAAAITAREKQANKLYQDAVKRQRQNKISSVQAENQRSQAMQNAKKQSLISNPIGTARYKHIAKATAANIKNSDATKNGANEVERYMKYQSGGKDRVYKK